VSDRVAELHSAGVDEYAGFPFGQSPEDRFRAHALLRSLDSID
jgi:hypothetical protein